MALRHGIRGSFLDVELELWDELRAVLARIPRSGDPAGAEPRDAQMRRAYCLAQAAQEIF